MLTWWYHPSLICILSPRVETIGDAYMVVSPLTDMYIITPGKDYIVMVTWCYHPSLICILLPQVETIGDAYMVVSSLTDMYIITPGGDYR